MLITYKKISNSFYSKIIWKINNDVTSRMFSKNTAFISYASHLKWLNQVFKKKEEFIYIARINKKIIGVIRERKIKNKRFLSWSLLKKFRGKGYGTGIVNEFVKKKKISFSADVHKDNTKSIKICKKVGFKLISKKNNFLTYHIKIKKDLKGK